MEGGGARATGRCRHTVPDWARYVRAPEEGWPILAACRLLVKEGEQVEDPRAIACGYWGRQPECPFYEGAGAVPDPPVAAAAPSAPPRRELPLTAHQLAAARLTADDAAPRGPLTDGMRQRRRATTAAFGLLAALALFAAWLMR